MIELRQLRYFVAVAELEHMGLAAERLHISQSPLSRQIMQIEAELGLRLFERVRRHIRLTREGRRFLVEARDLLTEAERVVERARRTGLGEIGEIGIGYVDGALYADVLRRILLPIRNTATDLHFDLRPLRSRPQIAALRTRAIDLGLLYSPPPSSDPDLCSRLVAEEPLLLAMPSDHPLAAQDGITPADLNGLPWIAFPRQANPEARRRFLQAAANAGFAPDIRFEAAEPLAALGLIGAGLGVALVQAGIQAQPASHVVFRPLPWFPLTVALHAVWRRMDRGPILAKLIPAVERMAEQLRPSRS